MRMVGSRVLFNQMRGRAVRTMDDDDFWQVTPGAAEKGQTKEYSVLVDAVGITDEDAALIDAQPVTDVKPSVPLQKLLNNIGMGLTDDDTLKGVALRLQRLNSKLADSERDEFEHLAGLRLTDVVDDLRSAADEEFQRATARADTGDDEPTDDAVKAARDMLVEHAIAQLTRDEIRDKLEALQLAGGEQYIHLRGTDRVIAAQYVENPAEAQDIIATWRAYIDEHRDEHAALKAFFLQPFRRRPTFEDIQELANAISRPPLNLTPERVWSAYEKLDASRVKGHGGKLTADLVRLIRYTLEQDHELVSHQDAVRMRFDLWVAEQESGGRKFSAEQMRWLTMVRDHIVTSMTFDPTEDYDLPPFSGEGGIMAAHLLFGDELGTVIDELNEVLGA